MFGINKCSRRIRGLRPSRRLSRGFIAANGRPALLTMPTVASGPGAYDLSGSGNPAGALTGGVTTTPGGFGVLGASWTCNGSTGYELSTLSGTTGTEFTVVIIFRMKSISGTTGIFQWASQVTDANPFMLLQNAAGTLKYFVDSGYHEISQTITTGTWYRAAFSVSSGSWKFYLNGKPLSTYSGAYNNQVFANAIYLGNGYNGYTNADYALAVVWKGNSLSASQISELDNCLLTGQPYRLFEPQTRDRFVNSASIINRSFFRRTLSQFGTRTGTRQTIG